MTDALWEINQAMKEILEAGRAADSDPNVKAIIITGSGSKAFAAGADIKEMASQTYAQVCLPGVLQLHVSSLCRTRDEDSETPPPLQREVLTSRRGGFTGDGSQSYVGVLVEPSAPSSYPFASSANKRAVLSEPPWTGAQTVG